MHALWNTIGKQSASGTVFYAWATLSGALLFSPLMLINGVQVLQLPIAFWVLLVASGGFQAIYFTGLAKAYRCADLSLVYPLARSIPVLIVPLLMIIAYGETQLTLAHLCAMTIIVAGALVLPLKRWRDWHVKAYWSPGVGWALIAALGTAAYSITDSAAVHLMKRDGWGAFSAGSSFVVLQGYSIAAWIFLIIKIRGNAISLSKKISRKAILLTGFFVMATYLLVLISMSMVEDVSFIVALRQLSIPIGVGIGAIWLKEKLTLPRITGVAVMLIGLMLVAL